MRLSVADDSGAICFAVDCEVSHSVAHLVQFLIAPTLGSAWPLDSIELRSKWATVKKSMKTIKKIEPLVLRGRLRLAL
jgi:hypothetical protein